MTPERRERILQVAHELENEGLEATNSAVYSRALGHRGDVVQVMRDRRAARNGGNVALMEDDDDTIPAPTAAELEEDLAQLTASFDAWHLALERLWEIEQEGPLSEQNFSRKQWLEYQMVQNLQAQERLGPQLRAARALEALGVAVAHYNRHCPAVITKVEEGFSLMGALQAWAVDFVALIEQQQQYFGGLVRPNGQPAFELNGGGLTLQHLLGGLQGGDGWVQVLTPHRAAITVGTGREAAAVVSGTRPFSETLQHRYREEYSHASHP